MVGEYLLVTFFVVYDVVHAPVYVAFPSCILKSFLPVTDNILARRHSSPHEWSGGMPILVTRTAAAKRSGLGIYAQIQNLRSLREE
jgi:hypothetical protein